MYCDKLPTISKVDCLWLEILEEEKSDAIKEISALSAGQKKVLGKLAGENVTQITDKATMITLEMAGSSIVRALEGLEEKDIIEKLDSTYKIINPVIKFYVVKGN